MMIIIIIIMIIMIVMIVMIIIIINTNHDNTRNSSDGKGSDLIFAQQNSATTVFVTKITRNFM